MGFMLQPFYPRGCRCRYKLNRSLAWTPEPLCTLRKRGTSLAPTGNRPMIPQCSSLHPTDNTDCAILAYTDRTEAAKNKTKLLAPCCFHSFYGMNLRHSMYSGLWVLLTQGWNRSFLFLDFSTERMCEEGWYLLQIGHQVPEHLDGLLERRGKMC
jgi:hypothetical protein